MFQPRRMFVPFVFAFSLTLCGQETHEHGIPERLGSVSFPISCKAEVQQQFDRGVALLHSFAYSAAERVFQDVASRDRQCTMAHWGIAMTHFHQLWEPPLPPAAAAAGSKEILLAREMRAGSERERKYAEALDFIYRDSSTVAYATRAANYERAMSDLAADDRKDVEAQVFYGLALLADASPMDKSHAKQKRSADLLEPLYRAYPQHPGLAHYLIHAYDNAELAPKGLAAARAYSEIAPSAPHALHMPSHIFTRLGLWDESVTSNLAAREAAHKQGDDGEELHAMDYLVYAYLQSGRDKEAAQIAGQLKDMRRLNTGEFKTGYAYTAIPIRYAVERKQWAEAAAIVSPPGAPPQVAAIAVWARGLGLARSGRVAEARAEIERLREIESQLRSSGSEYWGIQTRILMREVMAWSAQAEQRPVEAGRFDAPSSRRRRRAGKAAGDARADRSGPRTAWLPAARSKAGERGSERICSGAGGRSRAAGLLGRREERGGCIPVRLSSQSRSRPLPVWRT